MDDKFIDFLKTYTLREYRQLRLTEQFAFDMLVQVGIKQKEQIMKDLNISSDEYDKSYSFRCVQPRGNEKLK